MFGRESMTQMDLRSTMQAVEKSLIRCRHQPMLRFWAVVKGRDIRCPGRRLDCPQQWKRQCVFGSFLNAICRLVLEEFVFVDVLAVAVAHAAGHLPGVRAAGGVLPRAAGHAAVRPRPHELAPVGQSLALVRHVEEAQRTNGGSTTVLPESVAVTRKIKQEAR